MFFRKYKIGVWGNGGRELAICKALNNNYSVESVVMICQDFVNCGIKKLEKCSAVVWTLEENTNSDNYKLYNDILEKLAIDVLIVGSENDLANDIASVCKNRNIICIGPTQKQVEMETSKIFTRKFLDKHNFSSFNPFYLCTTLHNLTDKNNCDINDLIQLIGKDTGIVFKCNGLKGGKGVIVKNFATTNNPDTDLHVVMDWIKECVQKFNISNYEEFLLEEKLEGCEFSLISFYCDGQCKPFPPVFDYKQLYRDGPNTGGMCSVLFGDYLFGNSLKVINKAIRLNEFVVKNQMATGLGFLYGSFMITSSGDLKVIEYNCRLGDPEGILICHAVTNFADILIESLNSLFTGEKVNFTDFCVDVQKACIW